MSEHTPGPWVFKQASMFATVELDQMVYQITSAIEAGERAAKTGAERFHEAGQLLLQAKEKVKHGDWAAWCEQHVRRSQQTIRRWMLLAKRSPVSDLEETWSIICGHRDDAIPCEASTSAEPSSAKDAGMTPKLCKRCSKASSPKPNCRKCQSLASGRFANGAKGPTRIPGKSGAAAMAEGAAGEGELGRSPDQPPPPSDDEPTLAERLKTAYERLDKLLTQAIKTRDASKEAKDRAKDLLLRMGKAAEYFPALPVRQPFTKTCQCGEQITVAVTEKDKWIPLYAAERGNYEIIDGLAVRVDGFGGKWRFHMGCSPKSKQEAFL